jgi:hypothetical protein
MTPPLPYRYLREAVLNRRAVDEFTDVASATEMGPEFGGAIKHSVRSYEEAIKGPHCFPLLKIAVLDR